MTSSRTVDEAWDLFTTRIARHLREADESGAVTPPAIEDDESLAAFLRRSPGVFEERLLAGAAETVTSGMAAGGGGSALHVLWDGILSYGGPDGTRGALDATLAAFDPSKGLQLCHLLVWRHGCEEWAELAADFFAGRLDRAPTPHEAAGELRDALAFRRCRATPPDVLPGDIDGMSPEDVEAVFASYVGAAITDVEARLRPGRASFSGFLAGDERLGEVVCRDARRLRELGVSRRALADRLEAAIEGAYREQAEIWRSSLGADRAERACIGRPGGAPIEVTVGEDELKLQVWRWGYLGSQSNPFHTLEVESTISDFMIVNPAMGTEVVLRGSALAPALIRRFCFFEGKVHYRIEPELAARVLGLVE